MAEIEVERGRGPAYDDEKQDKVYESHDATVIAAGDVCDTNIDVHTHLWDGVQRRMEQRHMQMIALAGVIGTGLFLGSGKGGPFLLHWQRVLISWGKPSRTEVQLVRSWRMWWWAVSSTRSVSLLYFLGFQSLTGELSGLPRRDGSLRTHLRFLHPLR